MYYLVTGTLFVDGFGTFDVRETVDAKDEKEATTQVEITVGMATVGVAYATMAWSDDKTVEPLPADQMMALQGEQRLPGMEE